jgi:tricorn protease-like protein
MEVAVKLEGYEYSGCFRLDSLGEFTIRLRSAHDTTDSLILNVAVNEENNTYRVVLSDTSHSPPYRLENLTKTTFKISQKDSRSNDFDILKPF